MMTPKDMSPARISGGKLANVASCWATRTCDARVEMAMPASIDQPASRCVKSSGTSTWEVSNTAEATTGSAKRATAAKKTPETV